MLRRLLAYTVFLAGLAWLVLLAVARSGEVRRPWPIELLDTFALYAFMPFVVVALLAVGLRSRLLLGLVVAAGLLFAQQFGPPLLPRPTLSMPDAPTIRVLTYNVLWTNRDAGPLAELVAAERPDLIVLQELSRPYAEDL